MATTSMCYKGGVNRLVLTAEEPPFPREMCHEVVSPDVVNRAELQASQRSQLEEASQRQPGSMHVRTVASGSISKLLLHRAHMQMRMQCVAALALGCLAGLRFWLDVLISWRRFFDCCVHVGPLRHAMVCGVGHAADAVHGCLTSSWPIGGINLFRARSLYVWHSKSDVGKRAACSSTSLEFNPITVELGSSKANTEVAVTMGS